MSKEPTTLDFRMKPYRTDPTEYVPTWAYAWLLGVCTFTLGAMAATFSHCGWLAWCS